MGAGCGNELIQALLSDIGAGRRATCGRSADYPDCDRPVDIRPMLPAIPQSMPSRVACAIGLLAVAWLVSATALVINRLVFLGAGVGPGSFPGIIGLAIQAATIVLVARGAAL